MSDDLEVAGPQQPDAAPEPSAPATAPSGDAPAIDVATPTEVANVDSEARIGVADELDRPPSAEKAVLATPADVAAWPPSRPRRPRRPAPSMRCAACGSDVLSAVPTFSAGSGVATRPFADDVYCHACAHIGMPTLAG